MMVTLSWALLLLGLCAAAFVGAAAMLLTLSIVSMSRQWRGIDDLGDFSPYSEIGRDFWEGYGDGDGEEQSDYASTPAVPYAPWEPRISRPLRPWQASEWDERERRGACN